jgi:glutaredoxin-related protein
MTPRPLLSDIARTPQVAEKMANFHSEVVSKVADAVKNDAVVVVGMAQNPFVKKARAALTEANVPFTYLEFGSYLKGWKERLAIKLWSGWATFPQVYVRGTLIGGNDDLREALANGSLQQRLVQQ